jgi:lactobin A/cerein 7B family class IIb bacteriocin
MKNFELDNVKLVELSANQLTSTNGGIIPMLVVAGAIAFWGLAFYGSFRAGYDAAQK